jgi:hypothetical protein
MRKVTPKEMTAKEIAEAVWGVSEDAAIKSGAKSCSRCKNYPSYCSDCFDYSLWELKL